MQPIIIWSGTVPANVAEVEAKVLKDIAADCDMEDYRDLIFHHVFLGDMDDGPCVLVSSGSTAHEVTCEYHEKLEWTVETELDAATVENLVRQGFPAKEGMKVVASPATRKLFKN